MQCPRCGDEIEPDAECRRCQQAELLRSLAGGTQTAVAEKECPRCGKATRADAATCDKPPTPTTTPPPTWASSSNTKPIGAFTAPAACLWRICGFSVIIAL